MVFIKNIQFSYFFRLDFISFEVEPSLLALLGPILGWGPQLPEKEKALADLRKALEIIENHLKFRTFLVGNSVSLADISLAGTLVLGFKFLLEPKYRQGLDNIIRWFELISHQEAFFKVFLYNYIIFIF